MSPVYWKQKYATRGQRHRAWVKRQAARDAALQRRSGDSLLQRVLRAFRGNG
jgi:hypothetical protein